MNKIWACQMKVKECQKSTGSFEIKHSMGKSITSKALTKIEGLALERCLLGPLQQSNNSCRRSIATLAKQVLR